LARACYSRTNKIVLLDDPLSAVDATVGQHLLDSCILNGPLASQTRVLVTHQLHVLPNADLVLVMDKDDKDRGVIVQKGTYAVGVSRLHGML
jgi:ATP-binding cassette subfamily C (CFTR/MRP) protein 1